LTAAPLTVLAIDPGSLSGVAVMTGDELRYSGTTRCAADRRRIVEMWHDHAHVIVRETWSPGGERGFKQALGLGATWGRWQEALELADSKLRVVSVLPQVWRHALPMRRHPKMTREQWKASAVAFIEATYGIRVDDNAAEAACIALWATRADAVWDALPARVRRGLTRLEAA
jgi:hypothetical protein